MQEIEPTLNPPEGRKFATCVGCDEPILYGYDYLLLNDGDKVHDKECFLLFAEAAFEPKIELAE